MMEEDNILPMPPSGAELDAMELEPYWLDPRQNYPEPHFLLEYKGVGFSPIGGIQAMSGQKKNGKSFVITQLAAAILGSDSERLRAKLPGLQLRADTAEWLGRETSVLYVDTEMEQLNSAKVLRRIHWLCGWPENEPNPRLRVLWLRSVTDSKEDNKRAFQIRYELVKKAIAVMRPTAVFIDGIRDLIGDFNDNAEASALVTDLMALATEMECCIWNVLHANPRPKNDDEGKMRGHLGTELGNKVTDTLVSIKKKSPDGRVQFTVKQQDARGKDLEDWTFEITDDAGGLGIPRFVDAPIAPAETPKSDKKYDTRTMMQTIAQAMQKAIAPPSSKYYRDLHSALKTNEHIGSKKANDWIKLAIENNIISSNSMGQYSYQNGNSYETNDEAPF